MRITYPASLHLKHGYLVLVVLLLMLANGAESARIRRAPVEKGGSKASNQEGSHQNPPAASKQSAEKKVIAAEAGKDAKVVSKVVQSGANTNEHGEKSSKVVAASGTSSHNKEDGENAKKVENKGKSAAKEEGSKASERGVATEAPKNQAPLPPKSLPATDKSSAAGGKANAAAAAVAPAQQKQNPAPVTPAPVPQRSEGKSSQEQIPAHHVLTWFLALSLLLAGLYIAYHNRKKILGLLIEGRHSTGGRRTAAGSSIRYRRLNQNESAASNEQRNYIS